MHTVSIAACVSLVLAAASADAAPCDDLASPAAAAVCRDAFVADPAAPPDLGAGQSNMLGINHRLGDLSFVLAHGRLPTAADPEAERMRLHLDLALDILTRRAATRPELAPRRAAILALLRSYRDKGAVPINHAVARRNPVFIDDDGTICAVGYLVEQTAGRAVAESIARDYRYAYIEDMRAGELPAWVADSGFTAAELALIQPAYSLPPSEYWSSFVGPLRLGVRPPDGAFAMVDDEGQTTRGAWKRAHMDGNWERVDKAQARVGVGTFTAGRGRWTGSYPDGKIAVEGELVRDAPDGPWKAYYPSGHLAIEGAFKNALRTGPWSYYFDAPGQPLMARGRYEHVERGAWEHYDRLGRHVATSDTEHDTVTWYDPDGASQSAEHVANEMDIVVAGVAWQPSSGRVTRARIGLYGALLGASSMNYDDVDLRFDADGHLSMVLARQGYVDGGMATTLVMEFTGGKLADAHFYIPADWQGAPARLERIAIDGVGAKLAQRVTGPAERAANKHRGGPALANERTIAKAIEALDTALDAAPHTPVAVIDPAFVARLAPSSLAPRLPASEAVPPLFAACAHKDDEGAEPNYQLDNAWACETDAARQIQGFVAHPPTMITAGTNFDHLEALAATMMSFMPDRVRPSYDSEVALPSWMSMPPLSERQTDGDKDLFGELSSSFAPMLGRR